MILILPRLGRFVALLCRFARRKIRLNGYDLLKVSTPLDQHPLTPYSLRRGAWLLLLKMVVGEPY